MTLLDTDKLVVLTGGTLPVDGVSTGDFDAAVAAINDDIDALDVRAPRSLGSIGGTANAITAVGAPTIAAYEVDQAFYLTPATTNTGAVTINIDGLGARAIVNSSGAALVAGDLVAGRQVIVRNGASSLVLLSVPIRATGAEVITGTSASKFVTPEGIGARFSTLTAEATTDESGWKAAFTMTGGIALGVRNDGRTWAYLADDAVVPESAVSGLLSGTDIACWGDSLTEGTGGGGTTYPDVLATALDRVVYNGGVGGDTSTQIRTRFAAAPDYWPRATVICSGRNNYSARTTVRDDILAMVDSMIARVPSLLVLSVINGNYAAERQGGAQYDQIIALNETLAATFGSHYLDWRRYVIDFGLSEAGITPTSQDLTDIADDIVPASLRADNIHGTAAYYTLKGNFVARAMRARKY